MCLHVQIEVVRSALEDESNQAMNETREGSLPPHGRIPKGCCGTDPPCSSLDVRLE